jgi:hypothetical protein
VDGWARCVYLFRESGKSNLWYSDKRPVNINFEQRIFCCSNSLIKYKLKQLIKSKMMKKNMGTIDKVIRILVAVVVVVLYFTHVISGVLAIILLALSAIFVITSLLSFCPLYLPLGLSTRKKE